MSGYYVLSVMFSMVSVFVYYIAVRYASNILGVEAGFDFLYIIIFVNSCLVCVAQSRLIRILLLCWLIWPVVGVLNSASWSQLYSGVSIDIEYSLQIYHVFLLFFSLPQVLIFRDGRQGILGRSMRINLVWLLVILIFPFLMGLEMIYRLGFIPIFSGSSIVGDMYSYSYGVLYSYKVVMLLSMLLLFFLSFILGGKLRALLLVLLAITIIISLFDGKRVIVIAFFVASFAVYYRVCGDKFSLAPVIKYAVVFLLVYVMIGQLRSGEVSSAYEDWLLGVFYSFGVEYRDFALTLGFVEPGGIDDYDWFLSSVANLINSNIASLIGFDKNSYVVLDSARAFMAFYDVNLGIRTGLISELWFAYGWNALPLMMLVGLLVGYISRKVEVARNIHSLFLYAIVYAYLLLSIMGQSSVFFGVLLTVFYLLVFEFMCRFIFPNFNLDIVRDY